jgi:hypothetical protein
MTNFLETLMSRKGQIVTVKTIRAVKMRKGQPAVNKASEFQCRVGVTYDNIQAVQDGRADGTLPAENAGLPWGEWIEFPYTIGHKGETYVRCTLLKNNFRRAPVFTLVDGTEIARADVMPLALASEFKEKDEDSVVFNIKLSSILDVK